MNYDSYIPTHSYDYYLILTCTDENKIRFMSFRFIYFSFFSKDASDK